MKLIRGVCLSSFSALFMANFAIAGTLTVSSGPTLSTSGGGVLNTSGAGDSLFTASTFQFNGTTAAKLSGNQIFTDNNVSTASNIISVIVGGSATANNGDFFSLSYDFTLTLTGTGTVTPLVKIDYNLFNGFYTGSASTTLPSFTGPGTFHYTGIGNPSPTNTFGTTISGTYTATAQFTWSGSITNDTLRILVPSNSIDFASSPLQVPEPSSLLLLGAVGSVAIWRRPQR